MESKSYYVFVAKKKRNIKAQRCTKTTLEKEKRLVWLRMSSMRTIGIYYKNNNYSINIR